MSGTLQRRFGFSLLKAKINISRRSTVTFDNSFDKFWICLIIFSEISHWKFSSSLEYLIKIISFTNSANFSLRLNADYIFNPYFFYLRPVELCHKVSINLLVLFVARQQHGLLVIILADCCYLLRELSCWSECGRLSNICARLIRSNRLLLGLLLFICRLVLRLLVWVLGIVWWHTNATWILTAFKVIIYSMKSVKGFLCLEVSTLFSRNWCCILGFISMHATFTLWQN